MRTRVPVLLFTALALVLTLASACATAPPATAQSFAPPSNFDLKGIWGGTFTNNLGTSFAQTMILEEQRDGEVRGRYIGYRGNEVAGGIRGKVKLPKITFTLLDKDFTLTLTSENTMEGWTWDSPGGGVPGRFFFERKTQ